MTVRLERTLDTSGIVLLHPGRADRWWRLPHATAWTDQSLLLYLADDADHVNVTSCTPSPCALLADGDRLIVDNGIRQIWRDGQLERLCPDRRELPLGARTATDLVRDKDWAVWSDSGFVYRWHRDQGVTTLGRARKNTLVGPQGCALIGDDDYWIVGAPPDRPGRTLHTALQRHSWGVRFTTDGYGVAGIDDQGMALRLSLSVGSIRSKVGGALPVDAETNLDVHTGRIGNVMWGVYEASPALSGSLLGGPGGVIWDLDKATPCFETPALALGATIAAGDRWFTVDWETGVGWWVSPRTGERGVPMPLPLDDDDLVVDGCADGQAARLRTALGQGLLVTHDEVTTSAAPDPTATSTASVGEWTVGGLQFPISRSVVHAGREFGWANTGLLLCRPV